MYRYLWARLHFHRHSMKWTSGLNLERCWEVMILYHDYMGSGYGLHNAHWLWNSYENIRGVELGSLPRLNAGLETLRLQNLRKKRWKVSLALLRSRSELVSSPVTDWSVLTFSAEIMLHQFWTLPPYHRERGSSERSKYNIFLILSITFYTLQRNDDIKLWNEYERIYYNDDIDVNDRNVMPEIVTYNEQKLSLNLGRIWIYISEQVFWNLPKYQLEYRTFYDIDF